MRRLLACAVLAACAPETEIDSLTLPAQTLNAQTLNALLWNAILLDGPARDALVDEPLTTATFDPDTGHPALRAVLHDENAVDFMHYLVSCALPASASVDWNELSFDGALGLCPEWQSGAADAECQELVSACLLSRNNAHGYTVPISERGRFQDGSLIPLAAEVTVHTLDLAGQVADPFEPCAGPTAGAKRDCGWSRAHVGRCTPGQTVVVAAGAPDPLTCVGPVGASTGDAVLRACAGIRGCASASSAHLDSSDDECGGTAPSLRFTCPATRTFSVMTGAHVSGAAYTATPAASNATYPASEAQVFWIREGAFFGNVFLPVAPGIWRTVDPITHVVSDSGYPSAPTTVFPEMWACWDPGWTTPQAYLHERLCAQPEGADLCAATAVGPCAPAPAAAPVEDGADPGAQVFSLPVTTYLASACEIVPGRHLCGRR